MSEEIKEIKQIASVDYFDTLKIIIYFDGEYKYTIMQKSETIPIFDLTRAEKAGSFLTGISPFIASELKENIRKYKNLTVTDVLQIASIVYEGKAVYLRFEHDTDLAADAYNNAYKKYRAIKAYKAREQRRQEIISTGTQSTQKLVYEQAQDTQIIREDSFINAFFNTAPRLKTKKDSDARVLEGVVYKYPRHHKNYDLLPEVSQDASFVYNHGVKFGLLDPADFEGKEISKQFFAFKPGFEYFVMLTCDQLYQEGNREVSPTYFLKRMNIPYSDTAAKKLLFTLIKGASTHLDINNLDLLDFLNEAGNKPAAIIGPAMPIMIKYNPQKYRGNFSEMTIVISGYTPFRQIADPVKHLATFDDELLALYEGNKNDKYWKLMQYLYVNIAWLRNDGKKGKKRDNCFLMSTIWQELGDTTKHQKDATRKMFLDILEQCFIKRDYIYKVEIDPEDSNKYYLYYHAERKPGINDGKKGLVPQLPDKRKYTKKDDKTEK